MSFGKQCYGLRLYDHKSRLNVMDFRDEDACDAQEVREIVGKHEISKDEVALRKMLVTKVVPSYEAQEAMKDHIRFMSIDVKEVLSCSAVNPFGDDDVDNQLQAEVNELRALLLSSGYVEEANAFLKLGIPGVGTEHDPVAAYQFTVATIPGIDVWPVQPAPGEPLLGVLRSWPPEFSYDTLSEGMRNNILAFVTAVGKLRRIEAQANVRKNWLTLRCYVKGKYAFYYWAKVVNHPSGPTHQRDCEAYEAGGSFHLG